MELSVGRIVHYELEGKCMAAIVTDVRNDGHPDLAVFLPGKSIPLTRDCEINWHWPERTESNDFVHTQVITRNTAATTSYYPMTTHTITSGGTS